MEKTSQIKKIKNKALIHLKPHTLTKENYYTKRKRKKVHIPLTKDFINSMPSIEENIINKKILKINKNK